MPTDISVLGSNGFEKVVTTSKKRRIGTRMELPDGRVFYYALANGAIGGGKNTMEKDVVSGHNTDLAIAVAAAIGDKSIEITNATTAIAANDYEDGYVFVNDSDGEGQCWQILKHDTAGATDQFTVFFYPNDQVAEEALTTSSQVGLRRNPQHDVETYDADDIDGISAGVAPVEIADNEYFWNQTSGPAAVLTHGTVVLGKNVVPAISNTPVDGAVENHTLTEATPNTGAGQNCVGKVMTVAASTEYSLIYLTISR